MPSWNRFTRLCTCAEPSEQPALLQTAVAQFSGQLKGVLPEVRKGLQRGGDERLRCARRNGARAPPARRQGPAAQHAGAGGGTGA